jgi:hypothetical protein
MRRKIVVLLIIIVSILIAVGAYINQDNKKLKTQIDRQIETLAAFQLDGLELITENSVYKLRVLGAELTGDIESYKKELNTSAHVTYRIFKHEESTEVLFHEGLLIMEVWRSNVESDFNILGNDRYQSSRSYFGQILTDFSWKLFNVEMDKQSSDNSIELGVNIKSTRSSSSYIENFEMDDFGKITKAGKLNYDSVHYGKNLSMTINGYANVENMNQPVVVNMEIAKETGDYHPYWNLNEEQVTQIEFHYKGKYEEKVIINDLDTIKTLMEYIKNLQFEKFEEQIMIIDEYAYIMLDSYEHNIILSKNGVYTNSNHAVCKGKIYVDDILEIISGN